MSELDNKIYDAMKDKYPWAEDRPLSTELWEILERSKTAGASKGETYEECMKTTVFHILPLIETTGLSSMFVTAALRIIADLVEKNLDDREKHNAELLYRGAVVDSATITINREKK